MNVEIVDGERYVGLHLNCKGELIDERALQEKGCDSSSGSDQAVTRVILSKFEKGVADADPVKFARMPE